MSPCEVLNRELNLRSKGAWPGSEKVSSKSRLLTLNPKPLVD